MIAVILLTVPLVIMLCVLAYRLATYALPFMLALEIARFAYGKGAGWIGAGIVGFCVGVAVFGILAFLFATLRAPVLRIAVALIFAAPAAVAGYALVHGVTREAVPSEIWRQIFCIAGGIFVGCSALARLTDPSMFRENR
jgi:hypothetical protein